MRSWLSTGAGGGGAPWEQAAGAADESSAFRKPRLLGESYGTFDDGSGSSYDAQSISVGSGLVGSGMHAASADPGMSPRMPWPSSSRAGRAPSWVDDHNHGQPQSSHASALQNSSIGKTPSSDGRDVDPVKSSAAGFSSDYYNQDSIVPKKKIPVPSRKSPMLSPLTRDVQSVYQSLGAPPNRPAAPGPPAPVTGIAMVDRATGAPHHSLPPRPVNGHDILSDIAASYSKPDVVLASQLPPPLPMRSPMRVAEPAVRSSRAVSDPLVPPPPPVALHVPVPKAIPLHMRNYGGVRSSFSSVESSRSQDEAADGTGSSFSSSPSIPVHLLASRSGSDRALGAAADTDADAATGGAEGDGSAPPPPPPPPLTSSAIKKHWSRQYFTETNEYI